MSLNCLFLTIKQSRSAQRFREQTFTVIVRPIRPMIIQKIHFSVDAKGDALPPSLRARPAISERSTRTVSVHWTMTVSLTTFTCSRFASLLAVRPRVVVLSVMRSTFTESPWMMVSRTTSCSARFSFRFREISSRSESPVSRTVTPAP